MDGDRLDRGQDRLQRGNPAEVAASARTRRGASGRYDERGAGPVEGARAGEPGAAASKRDPAQGFCLFCPGGARPPVQAMIAVIETYTAIAVMDKAAVPDGPALVQSLLQRVEH